MFYKHPLLNFFRIVRRCCVFPLTSDGLPGPQQRVSAANSVERTALGNASSTPEYTPLSSAGPATRDVAVRSDGFRLRDHVLHRSDNDCPTDQRPASPAAALIQRAFRGGWETDPVDVDHAAAGEQRGFDKPTSPAAQAADDGSRASDLIRASPAATPRRLLHGGGRDARLRGADYPRFA